MQSFNINFALPSKWSELSDKQLRYVYQLIADGNDAAALQTLCLLQWGGAKVVGRQTSGAYLLKNGTLATPSLGCTQQSSEQAPALPSLARGFLFEVTPTTIAELLPHLAWLAEVPTAPVRLAKSTAAKQLPPTSREYRLKPTSSATTSIKVISPLSRTICSMNSQASSIRASKHRSRLKTVSLCSTGLLHSKIFSLASTPTSCSLSLHRATICSALLRPPPLKMP